MELQRRQMRELVDLLVLVMLEVVVTHAEPELVADMSRNWQATIMLRNGIP